MNHEHATTWECRRKDQLRLADQRIDLDPLSGRLIEEVAIWFRFLRDDIPSSKSRDILLYRPAGATSLPDTLRAAGLRDWAQNVESLLLAESPVEEIEPLSAERAIGAALGLFVGRDPEDSSFHLASLIRHHFHDAEGQFRQSAQKALQANFDATEKLRASIERRAQEFENDPSRTGYILNRKTSRDLVDNYMHHAPFRDVWCNSPYTAQVHLANAAAYAFLLRLDASAWLDAVELFPSPEPVAEIVRQSCQTYDDLAGLIGKAHSPFDATGSWRREHKLVFQLLQAAEDRLLHLSGPEEYGGDAVKFGESLDAIASAFAARGDASLLGHAWLEELAWKDYARRQWYHHGNANAVPDALLEIFAAIAAVTPPRGSPLEWIEGDDDVWRRDRLLAVVASMQSGSGPKAIGDLLTEVATRGLADGTDDFIEIDRLTAPCAVIGKAIVALADPAAWLRDLWSATFPLRDRARHRSDTGSRRRIDMNITCSVWGIAALRVAASGTSDARKIWIQTTEMIRETEITRALDPNKYVARGKRILASLWPQTFPSPPKGNVPGSLQHFLSTFAEPTLQYIDILLTLEASGAKLSEIRSASGGVRALRRIVSVVLEDTRRDSLRGRPNTHAEEQLVAFLNRI